MSASCAVKLLKRVRATGSAAPGRHGRRPGSGKLERFKAALIGWVEATPDITMPELASAAAQRLRRDRRARARLPRPADMTLETIAPLSDDPLDSMPALAA